MQLLLIFVANVLFLVLFRLFLKEPIADAVFRNHDPLNRPYYQAILDNLEFAGCLFSAIILLVVVFYDHIRNLIHYYAARETLFLGLCLALLASVQVCLVAFVQTVPIYDSVEYIKLGNRLFTQHAYVSDSGMPTAFWPVGYPAFLAFLRFFSDNNILLAKLANVIISAALVVVTFRVFREWLSPEERIVFILVSAFLPNLIFSSNVLLTDYPFTLLLWLSVLIYFQKPRSPFWFAVIGLLLGLMSYLRPVALLLPIVFLVSLWKDAGLQRHRLSLIMGGLIFVAILTPWTIRNYSVFGGFVPMSTNGGYNFLMGNRTGSSGGEDHLFPHDFQDRNEAAESSKAFALGVDAIVGNPIDAVKRLPKKLYNMYYRNDCSITWTLKKTDNALDPRFIGASFFFANAGSYLLMYLGFFTLSLSASTPKPKSTKRLLVSLYAYFLLITLIFFGNERYLIPMMPIHQFLCAKFVSLRKGS